MTRKDVIFQLNDLKRDAMSHFSDDGDDDIFRADVEALDAAIEALKEQPAKDIDVPTNRWISVKDRLPEESGYYLVFADIGRSEVLSYSKKYQAFNAFDDSYSERNVIPVTHWMPMPMPPDIKEMEE